MGTGNGKVIDHMTPAEVRKEVQRVMGRRVSDAHWETAMARGYVDEAIIHGDISDLILDLEDMERAPVEFPADNKAKALSQMVALWLGRRMEVKTFRRVFLKDHLLSRSEIKEWMETKESKEGDEMSPGPTLRNLHDLARKMCRRYPTVNEWHMQQFILTGNPPPISIGQVKTVQNLDIPGLSRITITVDPRISPQQLAKWYSEVRKDFVRKQEKPIEEKSAALAVFAEEHVLHNNTPWPELRAKWNAQYPDWRYDNKSADTQFARDSRNAWQNVTGAKWPRKEKKGGKKDA